MGTPHQHTKFSEVKAQRSVVTPLPSDDVQDIPARYVACRSLKHAWEPSDTVEGAVPLGLRAYGCVCLRCTMQRLDGVNPHNGVVRYRRYKPPEGYYRKKGQPKLYAPDYRLRLLTLQLNEITLRGRRGG